MNKTPIEILRGIADSYRLTADKAIDAIEDLDAARLREFADEIQEIADLLDQVRDTIEQAVDAREGGAPREEVTEAREAAFEELEDLCNRIESLEIPEAFDRLNLDHENGGT